MFLSSLSFQGTAILIIDGLDAASSWTHQRVLEELSQVQIGPIRAIISSRAGPDTFLPSAAIQLCHVFIHQADIELYVQSRLAHNPEILDLLGPHPSAGIQQLVNNALVFFSHGWVQIRQYR